MSGTTISQLPAAIAVIPTDLLPVVEVGTPNVTKRLTIAQLLANTISTTGGVFTGSVEFDQGILLDNNQYVQWRDTGGTAQPVVALDNSNNVVLRLHGTQLSIENSAGTVVASVDNGGNVTAANVSALNVNASATVYATGLSIAGNITATGSVSCTAVYASQGLFQIAGNYYLQRSPADGHWRFVEGGTITLDLDPSGNLDVRGGLTAANITSNGVANIAGTIQSDNGRIISSASGGNPSVTVWDTAQSWAAGMWASGSENFYFGAMDGTGAPTGTWYAYFAQASGGDFHTAGSIYSAYDVSATRDLKGQHVFTLSTSSSALSFWTGGGPTSLYFRIDSTYDYGPVLYYSDARLKRDIAPSKLDCLGALQQIELQQYRWLDSDAVVPVGFTTQQLHDVLIDLVNTEPKDAPPRQDNAPFYESVNHNTMIALLVGAVQQLAAKVDSLTAAAMKA